MTLEAYQNYLLGLKGIEPTHPFGPESVWYKLAGKIVSLTMLEEFTYQGQPAPAFHFINLKCDPGRAEELRASNPGIIPAWHQSKKHWNSVMMDGAVPDELIFELIDHSYELVFNSLTKKKQAAISKSDKK
ncbi:MAG: MmcQ/YjbR family DNA-binding protein [Bacteroidota bacterium]